MNLFEQILYRILDCCICCSRRVLNGRRLTAEKAPDPLDIIFENLEESFSRKIFFRFSTYLLSLALLVGSFFSILELT